MSDFDPRATIRVLSFNVVLIPGSSTIQAATANYEVVLPSGRPVPLQSQLDLTSLQSLVNTASATIIAQLLAIEGLTSLWTPGSSTPITAGDAAVVADVGAKS